MTEMAFLKSGQFNCDGTQLFNVILWEYNKSLANLANFTKSPNLIHQTFCNSTTINISISIFLPNFCPILALVALKPTVKFNFTQHFQLRMYAVFISSRTTKLG